MRWTNLRFWSSMASPFSPSFYCLPPEHEKEDKPQQPLSTQRTPPPRDGNTPYVHNPTPLHPSAGSASSLHGPRKATPRWNSRSRAQPEEAPVSVSCDKCRSTSRDKLIYVVPIDGVTGRPQHPPCSTAAAPSSPMPSGLRSLFLSLTRRSPASAAASSSTDTCKDQWRLVAAELSRKLVLATRKRDETLQEACRLKYTLAELESKVDRLESRCLDLRAALPPARAPSPAAPFRAEAFHLAVADARLAVRLLARSLISQIKPGQPGSRSADRVASLIQPYDDRAAAQWRRKPGRLLFHMEALLNRAFYADFEEEAGVVDPVVRCETSRASFEAIRRLGWNDVLLEGTLHYSEGLSRFCDRKMSEVVAIVGWAGAWPEPLLQAFFGAAKETWVVRLIVRSVHPAVPVLRVNPGTAFDGRLMDDVAAGRFPQPTPSSVRMMVAPGFHVYTDGRGGGGVVKCKVLCVYDNSSSSSCGNSECSNDTGRVVAVAVD